MIDSTNSSLLNLEGKIACVTGASSGLGRRAADVLIGAGAKVVGIARRSDLLEEWASDHGDRAAGIVGDLSDRSAYSKLGEQVSDIFGAPDILVNAAGINTRAPAEEVTPQNWDLTMDLNVAAPFFLAQHFVPAMQKKKFGRIINFASLQSFRAFQAGISYGASKGAITQLTRAMAEAWSRDGINANAIAPGFFPTELTETVFKDPSRATANAEQTCIGRNGILSDIDGPVLFFASAASIYVTGQTLSVDGGFTAK